MQDGSEKRRGAYVQAGEPDEEGVAAGPEDAASEPVQPDIAPGSESFLGDAEAAAGCEGSSTRTASATIVPEAYTSNAFYAEGTVAGP